jgi:hypothetical protein
VDNHALGPLWKIHVDSGVGAERYFFVCLPFTALGKRLPPLIAHLLMTVSLLYPLQNKIRQAAADCQEIFLM